MKISLCMIVKNEEEHLAKCLDNIKNHMDEIVIVDTGSEDRTKEIAREYTDKIYDFEWCDDFSKARNFSLSKASNDWVLILDADEVVTEFNDEEIIKFMNSTHKVVGRIKRINPFEDGKEITTYTERVNRLMNRKYFHYEGIIHEQITSNENSQYDTQPVEIEVDHIGYLNEVVDKTGKLERNISLLTDAIKRNPQDPYLYYQIGKSHYKVKAYEKACKSFAKAIEICPDLRYEYVEDLVESYGYALLNCERYMEAIEISKYENHYGQSPDYNFVMGLIFMNNGRFYEAIKLFEKCIGSREGKIEGINSYKSNYNMGVIYESLGYTEESRKYYERCGNYALATERLKHMDENCRQMQNQGKSKMGCIEGLINGGELEKAKHLIKQLEQQDLFKSSELYNMKAIILMIENQLDEAEATLKQGLRVKPDSFDLLYNLGYLYQVKQETGLAVEYFKKAMEFVDTQEKKAELIQSLKNIEG